MPSVYLPRFFRSILAKHPLRFVRQLSGGALKTGSNTGYVHEPALRPCSDVVMAAQPRPMAWKLRQITLQGLW
ncbi:hypothetical protein BFP76_07505 [Amylibacter kogurei]|uniref:Uncharacterized protein n=1 Tax=Paramylibacter kogurei TaxID=1889778 RepID=A0A2G5K612_9RHOB|nr:hypothetical protein BFP76_07505 [Amylibacter kogurei]